MTTPAALGYAEPAGTDMIATGDDAIAQNARASATNYDALYALRWDRGVLASAANLDTLTAGSYQVPTFAISQTLTPALPADALGGGTYTVKTTGTYSAHTWEPAGASTSRNPVYKREKNNATWTAWHRMAEAGDLEAWRFNRLEIGANTNLDTLKTPGMYYIKNATNANTMTPALPADARGGGGLTVAGGANAGTQTWQTGSANLTANPVYQREWNGPTVWTAWHRTDLSAAQAAAITGQSAILPAAVQRSDAQTGFLAAILAQELKALTGNTATPVWAYSGAAGEKLTIPTHVSPAGGQVVHPSILNFPGGWNGYAYWMGVTPYPAGNDAHEDPNIVASADGTTWVTPAGLTNPLDDQPGSPNAFNSDINLAMGPNNTMYCWWRTYDPADAAGGERIYLRTSTNGTTWTPKVLVWQTAIGNGLLSPSLHWTGTEWVMYAVHGAPSPNVLARLTSPLAVPTPASWSALQPLSIGSLPAGKEPWHVEIQPYGGKFYGFLSDCDKNKAGLNGEVYLLISDDGITWKNSLRPVLPQVSADHNAMYKTTFIPMSSNGLVYFQVWYSAWVKETVTWNVFRTAVTTYL